jgi:hypothetical protein
LDNNIVSIEEYVEKKPCYTSCGNCKNGKGIVQTSPPCISTLAVSAYNVYSGAPPMPTNSMGQGVNTATFEDYGLRSQVVSCFGLGLNLKYYAPGNNYDNGISHSEQCFRCLTDVASQANYYHFLGSNYSTTDAMNAIVNNSIQTVSCSEVNYSDETGNIGTDNDQSPIYSEMISIDSWAYKFPYTVFCNPTGNGGYCWNPHWACYNAINVGNVQDSQQIHYIQDDTATEFAPQSWCGPCQSVPVYGQYVGHCNGGNEQAANLPPRYGSPTLNNPFDCSQCTGGPSTPQQVPPQPRSDREMPMVIAPGISPSKIPLGANATGSIMADPCFLNDSGNRSLCGSEGTSYSAPICNGIVACVLSADSRMLWWPEKVRAAILATAQNVDFNYWNYQQDGRDGAGVICGTDAVWLAKNHTTIYSPNNTAVPYGICANTLGTGFQGQYMQFNISIPNPKPSGKHLRVVLTWDSSPSTTNGTNDLSDLDLSMYGNNSGYNSLSYESNVEMVDVPSSDLTPGNTYVAQVYGNTMRIPTYANSPSIYYAIAWTWVKDHAR